MAVFHLATSTINAIVADLIGQNVIVSSTYKIPLREVELIFERTFSVATYTREGRNHRAIILKSLKPKDNPVIEAGRCLQALIDGDIELMSSYSSESTDESDSSVSASSSSTSDSTESSAPSSSSSSFEFTPDLLTGINSWWESDSGVTTASEGSPVTSWVDQVSANDVIQATGSRQPTYDAVDADFNNEPSLDLDGGDRLNITSLISTATAGAVYVAFKINANTGAIQAFYAQNNPVGGIRLILGLDSSNRLVIDKATSVDSLHGDDIVSVGAVYVATFISSGSAYRMRLNGVEQSLTVTSGTNSGNWFEFTSLSGATTTMIGGHESASIPTNWLNGDLASIIIQDAEPTVSEVDNTEGYLAAKFGVTLP